LTVHDAGVPEPFVRSTVTFSVVDAHVLISPSIQLEVPVVLITRTRIPIAYAVAAIATLVVNVLDPVPIATDDVDVTPA
jgi:hypothetical protein